MKVVASWSGGKDSAYAYYLATQQGHQVINLFTMMMSESKSNFHMIPSGILDAQAEAVGIPLIKKTTSSATYEKDFKSVLLECKAKGRKGLVTGDIYEVAGHEEGWLGRVCKEVGLTPIKPLWMGDTKQIYLRLPQNRLQSNRGAHQTRFAWRRVAWTCPGQKILRRYPKIGQR